MLIWILALALFAGVALLGYYQGAIRISVSLIGLFLGAILAIPLSGTVAPLVVLAGAKHAVWIAVLPPLIVFLIILLVFMALSFVVHRKTELHYKYKSDDYQFTQWGILNKRLGAVIGVFMGAVWLFILGIIIHVAGYLTVQVASEDANSAFIRFLNQARKDLRSTGLEKTISSLDPAPPKYYHVADVIGLLYNNPILMGRLSQYPPFLNFSERAEFQEISSDTDYNNLLLSKAEFIEILQHPKTQTLLQNPEIIGELKAQDFLDLKQYLESGVSPKFNDIKILGRWKLDSYATMARHRKKKPDMSASELIRFRKMMTEFMPAVTFLATPDNRASVKAELNPQTQQALDQASAPPPAPAVDPRYGAGMSPELAQRYGAGLRGSPAGRPPGPTPAAPPPPQITPPVVSSQGTWEAQDDAYRLKLQDEKGQEENLTATADGDELVIATPVFDLVFEKAL